MAHGAFKFNPGCKCCGGVAPVGIYCGQYCSACGGKHFVDGHVDDPNGTHRFTYRVPDPSGLLGFVTDPVPFFTSQIMFNVPGCAFTSGTSYYQYVLWCMGTKIRMDLIVYTVACSTTHGAVVGFKANDWDMHFPHMEGFIGGFVGTMETPTCTGGETRSTHSYSCVDLGGGIGLCPPLSSATAILPMEEQREQVCCDPCAIPKVNLTLSYASFSFPDVARTATFNAATGTLVYSPVGTGEWSGCFGTFTETGGGSPASTAYVKWKLACDDFGATRLYFTLFTSSGCVGELATYNWSSVVDFTCEPLHLHLTMNVPELTGPTKFGDLYVDE